MNTKKFQNYVDELGSLSLQSPSDPSFKMNVDHALNGGTSKRLKELVSIADRRNGGAFFTSTNTAAILLSNETVGESAVVHDPACGAGDLLLQAAKSLGPQSNLDTTLCKWTEQISGHDLEPVFVNAAKHRLMILARTYHDFALPKRAAQSYFSKITVNDGVMKGGNSTPFATHIVMNPPFTMIASARDCTWASGNVNAAAIFLETAVLEMTVGARLLTVLPEVIRTGSRYRALRRVIESYSADLRVRSIGRFESDVDVDVFLLELTRTAPRSEPLNYSWEVPVVSSGTIGDKFKVSVGPVVPFRDKSSGPPRRYVHARSLPAWAEIQRIVGTRPFDGRLVRPPFLLIRRTSRPGDNYRAVATVVASGKPVAVENHLIVCEPKTKSIEECRELLEHLRSDKVNAYLNRAMRCRHLTVSAVSTIPFQSAAPPALV